MAKTTEQIIEIRPIEMETVVLRIVGDTPLIMHAWSEKAKRQLLEGMMKTTKTSAKEAKKPVEEFIRSMYWMTTMPEEKDEAGFEEAIANGAKFGFPVTAFKQGGCSAAYRLGWEKDKMGLRGAFFIDSDENGLVEIHSDTPIMREDLVRLNGSGPDIRYRGEFRNWWAELKIKYNKNGKYTLEQIVNVINAGGCVCGVGEWRPEKDGQFGMYHVEG